MGQALEDFLHFAAELETDAGASSGAPELWGAAGSHVAALGRLDDAVALVSALLPQRPPGPQPLPRKLVIAYKNEEDVPQYQVTIRKWNLAAELPPAPPRSAGDADAPAS